MSEDYFSIYIQYVLLISFGIYYFSFKDKDKFLVTLFSFMFLILSYPYISFFVPQIMPSTDCAENSISFDWVYPNFENATAAFKFNSDNTFNYSSVFFNITRYGTWEQLDNCSFKLTYQNGDSKTINISNNSFYIGETRYIKY